MIWPTYRSPASSPTSIASPFFSASRTRFPGLIQVIKKREMFSASGSGHENGLNLQSVVILLAPGKLDR